MLEVLTEILAACDKSKELPLAVEELTAGKTYEASEVKRDGLSRVGLQDYPQAWLHREEMHTEETVLFVRISPLLLLQCSLQQGSYCWDDNYDADLSIQAVRGSDIETLLQNETADLQAQRAQLEELQRQIESLQNL